MLIRIQSALGCLLEQGCLRHLWRGGKWSFKRYASLKILVEFHRSRSLVFWAVLYLSQSLFSPKAILESQFSLAIWKASERKTLVLPFRNPIKIKTQGVYFTGALIGRRALHTYTCTVEPCLTATPLKYGHLTPLLVGHFILAQTKAQSVIFLF